jgi:GntR family transcriptional regulator, transcriptional repressor for pyruvate dehydrogenase complex
MAKQERNSRPAGRRPAAVTLPPIAPLAVTRLPDDIADRIRGLIISENLAEGARLPPERELAERFQTSRPTISQALRGLALMGLVDIRRGSGAYVLRRPETMVTASVNLMLDLDARSVDHLTQLRLWLETLGVQEAATREPALTSTEVECIQDALGHLEKVSGHMSEWIAADTVFHATVVRSSGNPYLGAIYESVHNAVLSYVFKQWVDTDSTPEWFDDIGSSRQLALHNAVAVAVIERDAEVARKAVLAHHEVMEDHLRRALATPEA